MVFLVAPVPLSSEMESLLRRRKYALLHIKFRRRLIARQAQQDILSIIRKIDWVKRLLC